MPSMGIFGKKSKSKDRSGSEQKSKQKQPPPPQQQQQKQQQSQQQRSGSSNADPTRINGAAMQGAQLSPAERTAQRAAMMAASRKRMNTGDTPDYSITGSLTSSTKTPEKTSHKKLQKGSPEESKRKKKDNSSADGPSQGAAIAAAAAGQTAVESNGNKDTTVSGAVFSKTPPLQDSPTLGASRGTDSPPSHNESRSQPSVDSGYGSTTRSPGTNPSADANAMQNVRSSQLPRVDSGVVPKTGPASRTKYEHEAKVLIDPPTSKYSSRGGDKLGNYISRLDPGPSTSDFTRPVNFSKPSLEFPRANSSPQSVTTKKQTQSGYSTPAEIINRGRSTAEKPVSSPASPSLAKPRPQYAQPMRASSSSSRGAETPVSYTRTPDNSSPVKMANGGSYARAQEPVGYVRKSTTPEAQSFRTADTGRASPSSTRSGARFADGTTLMALQANNTNPESSRNSQVPVSSSNPTVANSTSGNRVSTQPPHSTVAPQQSSSHRPRKSSNTSSSRSTTGRRSTLPSISVLEGYKVNKRGQVLDEEGDAIGELFEGDLIDCVRQKINADGEVVDEFGSVVGRVRPVHRRPGIRYSEDSSALHSPILPRSMGAAFSSSSSTADRRDSESSQRALAGASLQDQAVSSRRSTQSKIMSPGLTSQTVISPVDSQGNAIVAELDASTVAESYPVIDHSEIFVPTFGASTQSPSQLIKAELPASERRESVASVIASRDASPAAGPKPKKWASRYFDPGPDEPNGPAPASRRNSSSPATRPSVRTSASQPISRWNSQSQQNTPISAIPILKDEQIVASPIAASPIVPPSPRSSSNPPPLSSSSSMSFVNTNGWAASPSSSSAHQSQGAFKAVLGPTLEDLAEEPPSRTLSAASASKAGRSTPNLHSETQRSSMTLGGRDTSRGTSPVGSRRASLQSGLAGRTSMYQPVKRSPLSHFEATPPGSSAAADPNLLSANGGAVTSTVPTTTVESRESEDAEAAPAPEIPKARARSRPGKKSLLAANGERAVDKRKSRFSIFIPGGKKEGVVS